MSAKRLLIHKESSAWLLLAEMYAAEKNPPDGALRWLCWWLSEMGRYAQQEKFRKKVATHTLLAMYERIARDVGPMSATGTNPAYQVSEFPATEQQQARVLACLLFSHEAKGEGR